MNKPRQDSWTKDEDILLAEIVLRHIRSGKTQLEAFKEAAETLSRTAAACGYRWNATIRKKHLEAIDIAKKNRKHLNTKQSILTNNHDQLSIETVISLLEKIKRTYADSEQEKLIVQLEEENNRLKHEVKRYQEAWAEMRNIWEWIEKKNEH